MLRRMIVRSLCCASVFPVMMPAVALGQDRAIDIPAGDLAKALTLLGRVTGLQLIYRPDDVSGIKTRGARHARTPMDALRQILAGTTLQIEQDASGAVAITAPPATPDTASNAAVPEILVVGKKSQNVDIVRTRNDPQPYVVFDSQQIQDSQATDLSTFLQTRLPMNTSQTASAAQNLPTGNTINPDNRSTVNLRGLGTNQTLILVDGRRVPRAISLNDFSQGDINGIPLSSIERIEILPSTAGAIYGGGGVGGVLNIIRKRNYRGLDVQLGHDGTFTGGAERFRAEVSGGFSLEGGKTQISFSGSYLKSQPLYAKDNDLSDRGRALLLANDPFGRVIPGRTTNIFGVGGANLTLKNGTALNANKTSVPSGYAGPATDGGLALVANAGRYSTAMADDAGGRIFALIQGTRTRSADVNIRRSFGSKIDAFTNLSFSDSLTQSLTSLGGTILLDSSDAGNPFNQRISVSYPSPGLSVPNTGRSQLMSISSGVIARLSKDWTATIEYNLGLTRFSQESFISSDIRKSISSDVKSGKFDILRDLNTYPQDFLTYTRSSSLYVAEPQSSNQKITSARLAGTLFTLPAGPVIIATLAERRTETVNSYNIYNGLIYKQVYYPKRSQSVNSGYMEIRVPIFANANAIPLINSLELQLSTRYDRYRTYTAESIKVVNQSDKINPDYVFNNVSAFSYMAAIKWQVNSDITFRSSYSTGFLPPSINQLTPTISFYPAGSSSNTIDPKTGKVITQGFNVIGGGNKDLQPELSASTSVGIIITPRFLEGFRFSLDYTRIKKVNEIINPAITDLLNNENLFSSRIIRSSQTYEIETFDISKINATKSYVYNYDYSLEYTKKINKLGRIRIYAIASYQPKLERGIILGQSLLNYAGFNGGTLVWRGNGGIDWNIKNIFISWNAQYYDKYNVTLPGENAAGSYYEILQGRTKIPSQLYNDVSFRYNFPKTVHGPQSGLSLTAGIQNIFNHRPPALASAVGGYSAYGDPRLRRFTIRLAKQF